MKVGSPEYSALMAKWSNEAWQEEIAEAAESYWEHEDSTGRLKPRHSWSSLQCQECGTVIYKMSRDGSRCDVLVQHTCKVRKDYTPV